MSTEEKVKEGILLPVMEEFYSLQGEGFNTGQAAWFIRIGGCDVGCQWCDVKESWPASGFAPIPADDVIRRARECPAGAVVVTGGEPMLYNLDYLCAGLKSQGIRTFLETSGSQELTGTWDWICVSPKKDCHPLEGPLRKAHELKVIICDEDDFSWAEQNAARVSQDCILFLQPEWSKAPRMIPFIVAYIKEHPRWRISIQSHKYMRIP
ncbi:MAG TPA: 7-carboxy-7-deazaguanine synthase QueE [Bacteroidales bacterium]|nr:7-carboxy-7-deazaguanine synthase QueE [Bacteroidales bacterium]HPS73756.1 7-carboxy-7-deazaguanine synthase QueE [Bacteroidales bacterium]